MSVAEAIDASGVAVITGGASGFGLEVALRLASKGMRLAILDIGEEKLATAKPRLVQQGSNGVLARRCDTTKFADCQAARRAVDAAFPGVPVSFLFNNAGIMGADGHSIIQGDAENWGRVFDVNVFGVLHIFKAFLPSMIKAGPLPSQKKTHVVTTSSVVGLLNHNIGPYSVSKMAVTAMCEQLALELESIGKEAAHIAPASLHPTIAGTNFFAQWGAEAQEGLLQTGIATASSIVDGFFKGLDEGKAYIIVDHELDVPTTKQLALRAEDQITGRRPRLPEQLAHILVLSGDQRGFEERKRLRQQSKL